MKHFRRTILLMIALGVLLLLVATLALAGNYGPCDPATGIGCRSAGRYPYVYQPDQRQYRGLQQNRYLQMRELQRILKQQQYDRRRQEYNRGRQ